VRRVVRQERDEEQHGLSSVLLTSRDECDVVKRSDEGDEGDEGVRHWRPEV
jgi:hypothetical protein